MRALITGINGFVGRHLASVLAREGYEVIGAVSPRGLSRPLDPSITTIPCDVRDVAQVRAAVRDAKADVIFHLAAITIERVCREDPRHAYETNALGTIHLLDAVREASPDARVLITGSSAEYGPMAEPTRGLVETDPLRPVSPYAISKATQSMIGYQYFAAHGLRVIRTRAFNHFGPGQPDDFVCATFCKPIAEIELGVRPPVLRVGNLDAQRDFSDVRDVVRAYAQLATNGVPGEVYNVARGIATPVRTVLQRLLDSAKVKIAVETDPDKLRPADVPVQFGSSEKLRAATGWSPQISLETSLLDTLNDWRSRVRESHRGT